jgi:hypothetical protein
LVFRRAAAAVAGVLLVIELVAKFGFADIIRAVEQNGSIFTFARR